MLALLAHGLLAPALAAQSVLERSPNLYGVWTLRPWNGAFVFLHRFELQDGGDELINIPTMTLALGLPLGLTSGMDLSTNSEVVGRQGGNETELWLKRAVRPTGTTTLAGIVGYNTAAGSADAALSARQDAGRLALFAEGRAFSDLLGSGEGGAAAALGAAVRLTPYLALTADATRILSPDSFDTAWSAGVAVGLPGTPHTLSLQATNAGSLTLHGASRERPGAFSDVRYGFAFTAPLTPARWGRIFRPQPPDPPAEASPDARPARSGAHPHPEMIP